MYKVYAFIDSQNLNLGVRNTIYYKSKVIYSGWRLDYKKFRQFLRNKYKVTKAFLFIGYIPGNEHLYEQLRNYGYIIIHKITLEFKHKGKSKTKGNVDGELILYAAAKEFENYNKAVIVSGDGDFYCLYNFLEEKKKLYKILLPNKHKYSSLLRRFAKYFEYVSTNRSKLEYIKKKRV